MRTLLVPSPLIPGALRIEGDEAHHGRTVLRLASGDLLRLADGQGRAASGRVVVVERQILVVEVGELEQLIQEPLTHLCVAVAPPKGDRLADLVRGLTELGVGTIQLLECQRSERVPGSLDRLHRVAREALKQCQRGWLPNILPAIALDTLVRSRSPLTVLDRTGGSPNPGRPSPTTLAVGPEGGFTADEFACLDAAGCNRVRLAGPILRIETAALAAAAVWASAWEHPQP